MRSWKKTLIIAGILNLSFLISLVSADNALFPGESPIVWAFALILYAIIKLLPEIIPLIILGFVLRYQQVIIAVFFSFIIWQMFFSNAFTFNIQLDFLPIVLFLMLVGSYFGQKNEKWKMENKLPPIQTIVFTTILIWIILFSKIVISWIRWRF